MGDNKCLYCQIPIPENRKYCSDLCKERYRYENTIKEKKCSICGKTFKGSIGTKCCSDKCKLKAQKIYKKVCPICNKKFKARGNGIYCSQSCYRLANSSTKGLTMATCEVCNAQFKTLKTDLAVTSVCSDKCSTNLFSTYINRANLEVFGTTNKEEIIEIFEKRRNSS